MQQMRPWRTQGVCDSSLYDLSRRVSVTTDVRDKLLIARLMAINLELQQRDAPSARQALTYRSRSVLKQEN
jgi:hypothetical protein